MKKIKITIRKDGTQKIEVLGAQGSECVEFTADLERQLGTAADERVFKPEFEDTEKDQEIHREQQRE